MLSTRSTVITGALAAAALTLSACGSPGADEPETGQAAPPPPADAPEQGGDGNSGDGAGTQQGQTTADDVFGPGCADVPSDPADPGSVQGMLDDPVGTAAGNNPLLTKLTAAVESAGLQDTLNDTGAGYTVFAPADPAFDAIPPEQLDALLTDPAQKQMLTDVLTYHVVGERMTADDLAAAGTVDTQQGQQLQVAGSGEEMTVNGARVLCGNVPTANATVFVIDEVLMPEQ
ncbi:fasciclin domain-containing protein [Saccharopolyspora sp. HNM0983]|uniref:Fasciclin domain-containing protein n=1 Tax=Saccharopolyspora montiporae TaxID=2781240 RepID=A0A929B630_9PSEU|nr:fasciclin domain-containing protein [Saccharopolyspora sp. HNM0983]MBE9373849.1 fasciclin domain-containing protein [Saccharopolyspora sp. HNM0983]